MTSSDASLRPRELAGYRVLRSLARDDDGELVLGFGDAESTEPVAPVLLKLLPATATTWSHVVATVSALDRARGDHVVRLLDVDADDDRICLVFERLTRGDLAELLRLRPEFEAGEAVTILAPLAATVQRLHAAGVAHGALGARTVLFRDDGAPVLIGFGHASCFEAGAPEVVLEREQGVVADRLALRELALTVLARVAGARARDARALADAVRVCDDELVPMVIRSSIFEVATARPVRFDADPLESASAPAARVVPIGPSSVVPAPPVRPRPDLLGRLIPDAWVQRVLDAVDGSPAAPVFAAVRARVVRRWGGWSRRRRRGVLAGGAAAVALLIALAVVPSAPAPRADALTPTGRATPSDRVSDPTNDAVGGQTPTAVDGDDPVAAAVLLVARRDRCLRSVSLSCLDRIDEPGSAALRADQAVIRSAQQGGEAPDLLGAGGSASPPTLVERLGDSALVRLPGAASGSSVPSPGPTPDSGPASLLLVKGEAGWRIRDVIAAGPKAG